MKYLSSCEHPRLRAGQKPMLYGSGGIFEISMSTSVQHYDLMLQVYTSMAVIIDNPLLLCTERGMVIVSPAA